MQLRPVDRATVRIVGLRGADLVRRPGAPPTVVPRGAHGSGVVVHPGGWILTARHVVEDADRLIVLLPGEMRAVAAQTVWRDPEHDLAIVRAGEPIADSLRLERSPGLVLGQAVDARGYPLDARERWPNATSGQVGRPLNDGRVQLSLALNPGNSGGPVVVDGDRLIGVVSQGGDPSRGVQGVVVMEPVGPAVDALARLLAAPGSPPVTDPVDQVLAELIGAAEPPPMVRRITRLREAAATTPAGIRGPLWALEAAAMRRAILREGGVGWPNALSAEQHALYDEATSFVIGLASGALADARLAARYGALRALQTSVQPCAGGTCGAVERTVPGRGWLFDFALGGGLAMDGDQRVSPVEGAMFSALGLFHLGNVGNLDPLRFNVIVGLEASVGTWRRDLVFDTLADAGVRLAIGSPDLFVALQLLYTPGVVLAESRFGFSYAAYRAMVTLSLGSFGMSLSWREMGRGANDTQRSLELLLSWGM